MAFVNSMAKALPMPNHRLRQPCHSTSSFATAFRPACRSFSRARVIAVRRPRTSVVITMAVPPPPPSPPAATADGLVSSVKVAAVTGLLALSAVLALPARSEGAIFNFRGEKLADLGVVYGRYLNGCPPTPNCISSSANVYDKHYVPPWTYNDETAKKAKKSMEEAVADLRTVIANLPRASIIESKTVKSEYGEGFYIHAEFQSKLLGFVDDVEFYFQPKGSTVEYRSASRMGESDFDVNRKRIREIRVELQQLDNRWASVGF